MDKFAKIAVLENEVEVGLVKSILTERSIPYYIRSFHDIAYDGIFQLQRGWASLEAPEQYREEIVEILKELRTSGKEW